MSTAGIIAVNQMTLADAMKFFGRCCGSSAWAMQLARGRPYHDYSELLRFADLKFRSMTRRDWLEAFIHIPDISEIVNRQKAGWRVTAQVGGKDLDRIIDRLDRKLLRYHRKFGHKFIPFDEEASLETLIAEITSRVHNNPQTELETICNHRRRLALRQLAEMIVTYRPQEGDGVAVGSTVTGEKIQTMAEPETEAPDSNPASQAREKEQAS